MQKRNTLQKQIILDALKELGNHPTPAMVYEAIHERYPTISPATVFRVLAGESEEGGEAQRVYAPGASARYEYGLRKHYHISCRRCGRVEDVEMPYQEGLERLAESLEGFSVERHIIEFIGLCPDCRDAADEK